MRNALVQLFVIIVSICAGIGMSKSYYSSKYKPIEYIDTLYLYKDSIIKQIDTLYVNKIQIQKEYVEKLEEVHELSDSNAVLFFNEYLRTRFSESINRNY